MIVAFWNVNTGMGSPDAKKDALAAWIAEVQPELLFLCEVGNTMMQPSANLLARAPGYQILNWVHTLSTRLPPLETSCNLVVLARAASPHAFAARATRFPENGNQRRMVLKVNVTFAGGGTPTFPIWGIHANASPSGGRRAAVAIRNYLRGAGGNAVVGGDINYRKGLAVISGLRGAIDPMGFPAAPPAAAPAGGVAALVAGGPVAAPLLQCTQWKTSFPGAPSAAATAALRIAKVIYMSYETHGVIDYAARWPGTPAAPGVPAVPPVRGLTAVPNCITSGVWHDIVQLFDHMPVVYDIT